MLYNFIIILHYLQLLVPRPVVKLMEASSSRRTNILFENDQKYLVVEIMNPRVAISPEAGSE